MKRATQLSYVALVVASALTSHLSFAEETKNAGLEVIEVTARKTVESLQSVPIAVTSIGAAELSENGIAVMTEVQRFSPNTTLQTSRGTNSTLTAFIRGVGQQDPLWGYEPGVGIYIDDVYMARPQGALLDIYDVERIEVLRGPQGTLFGRNTTGGAILLRSKQPEAELGGYINASVGQYNYRSVDGAVNIPLTDSTAMRFAFNQDDYDFSTNNLMAGSPDGGLKQQNFRLLVKSEFDDITIVAKLHQEDWSGKPKPIWESPDHQRHRAVWSARTSRNGFAPVYGGCEPRSGTVQRP